MLFFVCYDMFKNICLFLRAYNQMRFALTFLLNYRIAYTYYKTLGV